MSATIAFRRCLKVVEETSEVQATVTPAKDDKGMMSAPANRFAAALCCVLGDSAPGTTVAAALLLAHHPVVCHSRKGAQSLWKGILKRAFGDVKGITRLLQDKDVAVDVTTSILNALQAQAPSDRCDVTSKHIFKHMRLYRNRYTCTRRLISKNQATPQSADVINSRTYEGYLF